MSVARLANAFFWNRSRYLSGMVEAMAVSFSRDAQPTSPSTQGHCLRADAPFGWRPPAEAPIPPALAWPIARHSRGIEPWLGRCFLPGHDGRPPSDVATLAPMPRERGISDGFDTLGDAELVAVLLGTGEKGRPGVARRVRLARAVGGHRGTCADGASCARRGGGRGARQGGAHRRGFRARASRPHARHRPRRASTWRRRPRWRGGRVCACRRSITSRCGFSRSTGATACAPRGAWRKEAYMVARSIRATSFASPCAKRRAPSSSSTTTRAATRRRAKRTSSLRTWSRGPRPCSARPWSIT